jgi:RNA polymerase sigma-70 factor (ECF subfamily)
MLNALHPDLLYFRQTILWCVFPDAQAGQRSLRRCEYYARGEADIQDVRQSSFAGRYSENLDSASAQSTEINASAIDSGSAELYLTELSGLSIDEFRREARADSVDFRKDELASLLVALGARYNYGLAPGVSAGRAQIAAFWRSLQLQDLALAHACALGRDAAWRQFMARFRDPLTRAAIGITGSATAGEELAGSLYSEMFGLTERNGQRQSPLAGYSGRGSLMGFLRATLAQRNVDRHRRTNRETSLPSADLPAGPQSPIPAPALLSRLGDALNQTLRLLAPEERFILSAWFLDQRTLLDISRVIGVHEATVSRRLQRLTSRLRKELLNKLQAHGMSRAAADEALGTDPRDLEINLRSMLQASQSDAFPEKEL